MMGMTELVKHDIKIRIEQNKLMNMYNVTTDNIIDNILIVMHYAWAVIAGYTYM